MGLVYRVHKHKAKLKKNNNDDTFRPIQNPGTPKDHKFMTSNFDVIDKLDQRTLKQGNIYSYKQTQGINTPYKNKFKNRNS